MNNSEKGGDNMYIKELTFEEFENFAKSNPLENYMQTREYARFMGELNFTYDFIGLLDESGQILAASLILFKKIYFNIKYGYAPKGFLINYYDQDLLNTFVTLLKDYYAKKNIAFIKINPEIVIGEIDNKSYNVFVNNNQTLKNTLQESGFTKLKDNIYFESIEPRFNAYINLKENSFENYSKTNRNKIKNSTRKGLYLEIGEANNIDDVYKFFKTFKSLNYYRKLYDTFNSSNKIDLILVRVDFEQFIKNNQAIYEKEEEDNRLYNEIIQRSRRKENLNRKMASDAKLCTIKNEIIYATEGLKEKNKAIIAGALVIKSGNRVHIIESGFDPSYSNLNANYFLYNSIIEYYKKDYDYLDLNGITGDFTKENVYRGLNRFKLGFNPKIYEYIGEFDLVLNKMNYEYLLNSGKLKQEFNKK